MTQEQHQREAGGGRQEPAAVLAAQLRWHWENQARPRLTGLTDAEYFWEPVPGSWNVHPRGTGNAPVQAGTGDYTIDFAFPEPVPAPVTTIAWRLAHLLVGSLTPEQLAAPVGEAEGRWAQEPMSVLVLHINREMIHHLAEVALLRDLYAHGLR